MAALTGFDHQLVAAQQRLATLWQTTPTGNAPENSLLTTVLTEFGQVLEELQIAGEELYQQNSALAEARQALEAERQRYQQLFDFAPDGYVVTDVQGIIQEANQVASKLLGVAPLFLVGKPLSVYVHADDNQTFRNLLTFLGAERLLPADGSALAAVVNLEIALQPRTGPRLPVLVAAGPVPDPSGQVTALRWLLHDISERKAAEEALQQSEERNRLLFNAILDVIPDAVLTIDRTGVFLDIKSPKNFAPAFAVEPAIGKKVSEMLLPGALAQRLLGYHQMALESGEIQTFDYEVEVAGKFCIREARLIPVSQDSVLVLVRDLTQQKAAEAAKNQLVDQVNQQHDQVRRLTGHLAEVQEVERKHFARELHDQVGQTLTALALNLNLLKIQLTAQGPVSPLIQSRLTDSLQMLEQMMSSVRDVLSGLHSPVLDDYGLLAGLAAHSNQVQELTPSLTIKVTGNEPEPRLPTTVENALYRITQEALTNIVRHAQATRVTVHLQTIAGRVRLTITDNGQGFALEDRAATATQRPSWGLLIMRERAEAVGAQFHLISRVGQGTTVKVEIAHPAKA